MKSKKNLLFIVIMINLSALSVNAQISYNPQISDIEVIDQYWSDGSIHGTIWNYDNLTLILSQKSNVTSGARITPYSNNQMQCLHSFKAHRSRPLRTLQHWFHHCRPQNPERHPAMHPAQDGGSYKKKAAKLFMEDFEFAHSMGTNIRKSNVQHNS